MRVFVYEYLTATGIGRDPADPLHAMYREGRAMRDALTDDFGRLPGVDVELLDRFEGDGDEPAHEVRRVAERSDWAVVIAPETGGLLDRFCRAVRASAGKLLGPSPEAVSLTSDKLALADHWRTHGVRTPATTDRGPTTCEAFPVVWKPRDGAGSENTFLLRDGFDVTRAKASVGEHAGPMVLQEYVPGRAASVAFLCGPAEDFPLVPAFQHLSDDGRFKYLGGELPIPPDLATRAVALASRAVTCVPGLLGYVGVDLVLGDAPDGSQDHAIEINPRLTTSYAGLRASAGVNLAGAMLAAAVGEVPALTWKPGRVRFTAGGVVAPAG
ncbi:MAG: ATP-grasp domain-containing protein [Gemmataceae bacterium]|nr:ATP-grasp domain-containing protein [Gemmataceae bacterium]